MLNFIEAETVILDETVQVRIYYAFTQGSPASYDDPGYPARIEYDDMTMLSGGQWVHPGDFVKPLKAERWAEKYLIEHRDEIMAIEAERADDAKATRAEMRREAWRDN